MCADLVQLYTVITAMTLIYAAQVVVFGGKFSGEFLGPKYGPVSTFG